MPPKKTGKISIGIAAGTMLEPPPALRNKAVLEEI